ncbi:MAG: calcium-translocating P-type ATPase, PMCA-type [Bacteroidaceae bacterium]|nr:calcium-translocating P-type ATPase, PMCA-type [Bacteroidaceae bacterium]
MTDKNHFDCVGLTQQEVEESRAAHGNNRITPPKQTPAWKLYLEKFNDPIIRILLIAALLSLGIGLVEHEFAETIGILAAILLATGIGFYFELDAKKRFNILNALTEEEPVVVIRDGHIEEVPRSQVVVGDIVVLEPGCEVPADGELLQANHLEVNESSLTGELSVHKTVQAAHFDNGATYASNRMLRSTMVMDGNGIMRVDAVGDATEFGHVAYESSKSVEINTPLQKQLTRLADRISVVSIIVSILIFVVCTANGLMNYFGWLPAGQDTDWLEVAGIVLRNFMIAVTLIVMAVPEGLPMAITLSLALNMRRMLRTNNLVRQMHASETMGAVTVICTDKTGTLTQSQMSVADLAFAPEHESVLLEGIAANTTAHIGTDGQAIGNPTECALLLYMQARGADYASMRRKADIVEQLPFSTERKYMATWVRSSLLDGQAVYVKGAPEVVLAMCRMDNASLQSQIQKRLAEYQQAAMRTLAFAYLSLDGEDQEECTLEDLLKKGNLQFLGLAAIDDPVRPEVPAAVDTCRKAGIQIKIVTGDNEGTTIEVARRIGLWTAEDGAANAMTGARFTALSDEEALKQMGQIKVLSRARPMDKQRLVQLLQRQGEVVAVTGDGTNDAPALNHAEVGLSMGSGTRVAKEASDITLLDDSFGSIATAVEWGRSLYKNIQRFLVYQLTICITALVVSAVGAVLGHDMPLTVTQILWINLIMDTFASLALSTLPPTPSVMQEKPRRETDFIISRTMLRVILLCAALFLVFLFGTMFFHRAWGISNERYLTIFFTLFVLFQFWNLLNVRTVGGNTTAFTHLGQCKGLLFVMAVILAGQFIIVQIGGSVFRTVPLAWQDWLWMLGVSSSVLWIGEIVRAVKRRF